MDNTLALPEQRRMGPVGSLVLMATTGNKQERDFAAKVLIVGGLAAIIFGAYVSSRR